MLMLEIIHRIIFVARMIMLVSNITYFLLTIRTLESPFLYPITFIHVVSVIKYSKHTIYYNFYEKYAPNKRARCYDIQLN